MSELSAGAAGKCPICAGEGDVFLRLADQPIYQHPVSADARVEPPYVVDLQWSACRNCSHGWQPSFDEELLARIYRSHYYTPAPGGIGNQFRDDFIAALGRFALLGEQDVLLEIGASDGDVLSDLRTRTAARRAYAFEPNTENAGVAEGRGLEVHRAFFGKESAHLCAEPATFVYARHVIEHIFDFEHFFAGVAACATPDADLVLETPSLDFFAREGSIAPFQIEHIHVFSLRSLAALAQRFGWGLTQSEVTADGNVIAAFKRRRETSVPAVPFLGDLQRVVDRQREQWRDLTSGRQLIFWGAGSTGVVLARTIGREPDFWTDGNPSKIGKKFAGMKSRIITPEVALAALEHANGAEPLLVIASAFGREIAPRVRELGWQGEVRDMNMLPQ